jgi:toxin CcdB
VAQFDLLRVRSTGEILVDCQSDLLRHLPTRFAIPLFPVDAGFTPAERLNPVFEVEGESLILGTQYAVALPLRELTEAGGSLDQFRLQIIGALDLLIGGV